MHASNASRELGLFPCCIDWFVQTHRYLSGTAQGLGS